MCDGLDGHISCAEIASSINACWTRLGSVIGVVLKPQIMVGGMVAEVEVA